MKRHCLLSSKHPRDLPLRRPLRLLCAAGLLLAGTAAQAQLAPYFVRVSERISYDSNVFRVSSGERRDAISLTSLTVGVDQPIGRQRVYASATANYTAYKNNDQLNSPGYNLLAGLNWEAASKLSGEARANIYQAQASLADYGNGTTQQNFTGKNVERAAVIDLSGQYGGASLLALQAVANHTDIRYSADAFADRERKSNMVGGGLSYRPNIDWVLGVLLRGTKGEYPRGVNAGGGVFLADDYDRRDADLTAAYTLSGITSFSGRLTYTKEDHEQLATRDFSGLTGEVTWNYRPTGKLGFGVSLGRDTGSGAQGSLLASSSTQSGGTSTTSTSPTTPTAPTATAPTSASTTSDARSYLNDSRVTDRLRIRASWAATARIAVFGDVGYARERYDTVFVGNNGNNVSSERGKTRSLSLSARYAATRVWSFECGAGREERSADSGLSTTYDYDATTGFCSVILALQ